jgi:DNA-binding NarL/FixJ family response regulator
MGEFAIIDHFFSEGRCYCVAKPSKPEEIPGRQLSQAQRQFLRRLILGEQQKSIALDLGISCTAVTLRAKRCLRRLSLDCRPSAMPLFVLLAGLAYHDRARVVTQARLSYRHSDGELLRVYSFARVDARLPPTLSQAEQQVTRLLVEGFSSPAIAKRRGTATRTTVNQIGAVFAKLGVSGRIDLVSGLSLAPWLDDDSLAPDSDSPSRRCG